MRKRLREARRQDGQGGRTAREGGRPGREAGWPGREDGQGGRTAREAGRPGRQDGQGGRTAREGGRMAREGGREGGMERERGREGEKEGGRERFRHQVHDGGRGEHIAVTFCTPSPEKRSTLVLFDNQSVATFAMNLPEFPLNKRVIGVFLYSILHKPVSGVDLVDN